MSTSTTAPLTVQYGKYYGFSAAQIAVAKARYVAAVQAWDAHREAGGGGSVTLTSVNGRQVALDHSQAGTYLQQWRQDLQNAEAQLAGECARFADRAAARFR